MSVYRVASLACAACGTERPVKLVDSANPLRHPPFHDELVGRTFHRFRCPSCAHVDVIDGPLLWTQVTADLVAWLLPDSERRNWQAVEAQAMERMEGPVRHEGPDFVRAWGQRARIRVVFGLEELRDKVVIRSHRLDDSVVEALKLPLADFETGRGVVVEAVDDDGLRLAVAAPSDGVDDEGPAARTLTVVSWEAYTQAITEREALAAAHPGLFAGAWIHWSRAPVAASPA